MNLQFYLLTSIILIALFTGCDSGEESVPLLSITPFTEESSSDFWGAGNSYFHTTNFDKAKREVPFLIKPDLSGVPYCKEGGEWESNFKISGTRTIGLEAKVLEYVMIDCKHPNNHQTPPPTDDFRIKVFQINDPAPDEYNPSIANEYKKLLINGYPVNQRNTGDSAFMTDFQCGEVSVRIDSYGIEQEMLTDIVRSTVKGC